jgi:hypothetical protein
MSKREAFEEGPWVGNCCLNRYRNAPPQNSNQKWTPTWIDSTREPHRACCDCYHGWIVVDGALNDSHVNLLGAIFELHLFKRTSENGGGGERSNVKSENILSCCIRISTFWPISLLLARLWRWSKNKSKVLCFSFLFEIVREASEWGRERKQIEGWAGSR